MQKIRLQVGIKRNIKMDTEIRISNWFENYVCRPSESLLILDLMSNLPVNSSKVGVFFYFSFFFFFSINSRIFGRVYDNQNFNYKPLHHQMNK